MAKRNTTKPEEKKVETPEEEVEGAEEEKVEAPKTPKAPKGLRVVGLYDGQTLDIPYVKAEDAKEFCDKVNNSGRNGNNAKVI